MKQGIDQTLFNAQALLSRDSLRQNEKWQGLMVLSPSDRQAALERLSAEERVELLGTLMEAVVYLLQQCNDGDVAVVNDVPETYA